MQDIFNLNNMSGGNRWRRREGVIQSWEKFNYANKQQCDGLLLCKKKI